MHYRTDSSITLADGGRLMTGGEVFTLRTNPGAPLMLVARLHQTADLSIRVHINDNDAGLWLLPAIPGEWIESTFLVPADFVTSEQIQVALTVEEMFNAGPEARYSPFYYWAYQGGEIEEVVAQPQNTSQAIFDEATQLQGYDLSGATVEPGDTLSLTLYWRALEPPHADLRVFTHLVDPERADSAEGIIAQADTSPHQGTYPFWIWQQGEMVDDTLLLAVPTNAPPGEYLLLMGVYDAGNGQRLSIAGADDFGSGRLLLTTVTIR
jgi:hypothetical protein